MSNSPLLSLPFMTQAQAQKHVTHNDALYKLDALVHLSVLSSGDTTPPGSPTAGDRYILGASPTGDWSTASQHDVAAYLNGAWEFFTPVTGWRVWVQDTKDWKYHDGSTWSVLDVVSGEFGSSTKIRITEEELTGLSGATATSTISITAGLIILGVSVRVTTSITGATTFDVGDGTTVDRFAAAVAISSGTTDRGAVSPALQASSVNVVLTANGSNFTAGAVRIAIHYIQLKASTS